MLRVIGHLDMDAFFAAIEERDNPRFRGKPIVVGADPEGGRGRGVVSTANYKAREYGIHSAMPISTAWRLAEAARRSGKSETIFLEVNFKKYEEISERVAAIIRSNVPLTEEASIDESYMDLSFCKSYETAIQLIHKIKDEIKNKENLTCSVGIGPNKLIAKIASDMKKPDGLTAVEPQEAEKFLEPLSVRKIPGIGPKTEVVFNKLGVRLVCDLKKFTREKLHELFGKWGEEMYERARGRDDSPVAEGQAVKSVGEQITFPKNTRDSALIFENLEILAKGVFRRFEESGHKTYKTIVVTVRFHDFQTQTRSHTFPKPAKDFETLRFESLRMLMPFLDKRENPRQKFIRLIGVRVEKLE